MRELLPAGAFRSGRSTASEEPEPAEHERRNRKRGTDDDRKCAPPSRRRRGRDDPDPRRRLRASLHALQIRSQLRGGLVAQLPVFLERRGDDAI